MLRLSSDADVEEITQKTHMKTQNISKKYSTITTSAGDYMRVNPDRLLAARWFRAKHKGETVAIRCGGELVATEYVS